VFDGSKQFYNVNALGPRLKGKRDALLSISKTNPLPQTTLCRARLQESAGRLTMRWTLADKAK
jgi:hypothetical protein